MPPTHLLLFLVLSAIIAPAQTASELTVRYGDPDVERFRVRPGITLMARYAGDRTACEIMRPEVMTEIIEEVLPEASRGKLLLGVITKSGCNDLETEDYENVTIHRFRHRCRLPDPEIEGQATITRKNTSCTVPSGKLSDALRP